MATENEVKILKDIAFKIIDFISQFEDELVEVWNKPKFVKNSNYVVTIDRLTDAIIEKILSYQNLDEQVKEWQDLGIVDENFEVSDVFETDLTGKHLSKKYEHLPIDTKYFKDLELEILSLFDDLDNSLDGWLIKSENYQALNTILPKFKEKVQTVYIDPPFNTGKDFAYLDSFQDSSWLTLMENRIGKLKEFIAQTGMLWLHLDYNNIHLAKILVEKLFGKENFINEVIWRKRAGAGNDSKHIANEHDNLLVFAKDIRFTKSSGVERSLKLLESYGKDDKGYYYTRILDAPSLRYSRSLHYDIQLPNGKILQARWYVSKQTYEKMLLNDEIIFNNDRIYFKRYIDIEKNLLPNSIFLNAGLNADGTRELKQLFGEDFYSSLKMKFGKPTIKPEKLLLQILQISANNENRNLILDCFLGYGTTTAVAHKLGRKWIGIEMGDHFYSVVLPRMKKVLAYDKLGISKDVKEYQGGGFFKYYEFEQYEEVLSRCKHNNEKIIDTQDQLYSNIDIAETISNLTGKWIKKINRNEVEFEDGTKINIKNLEVKDVIG
jgi:adenine specific DNA methylase Mod